MKNTLVLTLIVLGMAASTATAATRLTYFMNGKPVAIEWPASSFPITFHVARELPARLPQVTALIPQAFSSWQAVASSTLQFQDGGLIDALAGKDGRNVITVNDTLFADNGFLAYTTTWFDENNGRIIESDIQIDAKAAGNGTNLEALIQHEIGHFLGLDHSAVLSSVMYPYVCSDNMGLDSDDRIGIANIYPRSSAKPLGGVLRGEVRDDHGGVFGVQVVALSREGSPVATTLTDTGGRFELLGIPDGAYSLYAEPLDGPVQSTNFSGIWRDGRSGFRTEFLAGETINVTRGEIHDNLSLQLDSRPASLNPRWIGAFPVGSTDMRLTSTVTRIKPGETVAIAIGGDGFLSGVTSFEVLNQGFTRISDFQYGPNFLWAAFRVAPDTPATSVVVRVVTGDENAALTGAIQVDAAASTPRRRGVRS